MITKSKVLSNKILSNAGLDISGSKLSNVVNNNIMVTSKENPYDSIQTEKQNDEIHEEKVKYGDIFGCEVLKKIIYLHTSNSLKFKGKLIVHNDELIDLIKTIMDSKLNSDTIIEIDVDYEVNCCGANKGLNIINKILVKTNDESNTVDMKYKFNEEYNAIQQFGVSLEYTID